MACASGVACYERNFKVHYSELHVKQAIFMSVASQQSFFMASCMSSEQFQDELRVGQRFQCQLHVEIMLGSE